MLTAADIRWTYMELLGREVEDLSVIEAHISKSRDALELKREIFRSEENLARKGNASLQGGFSSFVPNTPKTVVLGNCTAPNIARYLAAATGTSIVGVEEAALFRRSPALVMAALEDADNIVTCQLSKSFGPISTQALQDKFPNKKIITHAPPYFSGLLPDITYWGDREKRQQSGIGPYHSKLVLRSFLLGETEVECLRHFEDGTMQELGFFDEVENSLSELAKRDLDSTLKLSGFVRENFKDHHLFYTTNHPTGHFFSWMVEQLAKMLDLPVKASPGSLFPNSLANNVVWPVYNPLKAFHNTTFESANVFTLQGLVMTLEEFVFRSFTMYEIAGRQTLLDAPSDIQRAGVPLV